jgi:hypothetical protein
MMDHYWLMRRVPWLNASATIKSREKVIECVAWVLDEIEKEKRKPDNWEAQDLICAMWFIRAGSYATAFAYVRRALIPIDERLEVCPVQMKCDVTVNMLRNALLDLAG